MKTKLLFAGYRQWALDAYAEFTTGWWRPGTIDAKLVVTQKDLLEQIDEFKPDITFLAGWSWIIPAEVCKKHYMVVFHPSDLPDYAGGTPIQHQIIDGITHTKATTFRVTPQLDGGGILSKVDLSLEGNMSDIFNNLKTATVVTLTDLLKRWPDLPEAPQGHVVPRKRLRPEDSKLTPKHLEAYTAQELYNFMRCHEDPYPNVYVEDETGKLLIKLVKFEPREPGVR